MTAQRPLPTLPDPRKMSHHLGIFSSWLSSGVGQAGHSFQEGRVVGSVQRGCLARESWHY